jgi:predicted DNA-binding transcriptional regulator AlpA
MPSKRKARSKKVKGKLGIKQPELAAPAKLLTMTETCQFFGGSKPINPATLYRGIKAGRYPAPVKIGPNISRWLLARCEASLAELGNHAALT